MNKITLGLSLLACAAWAAPPQSTSLPTYWRYVHPKAKALVGVDIASIMASPLGQRIKKEFKNAGFTSAMNGQGMDFIWNAERILISAPTVPSSAKAPNKDSQAVIAMQGRFDLAAVRKAISSKGALKSAHRGVELLLADKGADGIAMALVSPQLLIMGDRASVRAALDHHAFADPSASTAPLFLRAMQLAQTNDLWFVSEPGSQPPGKGPSILESVDSFEGGVSFKSGLGLSFHFNTKTQEEAVKLGQGLQGMLQLFTLGAKKDKSTEDLLNKLQVGIGGSQVRVAVNFTQQELDRGISQFKAGFQAKATETLSSIKVNPSVRGQSSWTLDPAPAPQPAAQPEPEPAPEPDAPFVVKIFNADGGTKQLEIKKQ
ncbi:MAG: hypothetical protein FJW20_25085 [Acidimicrobiia bacterium]|nr:hypothetical protein [Acidimicrobiia bacterium]